MGRVVSGQYGTAYEVLGVAPEASQAQISDAYRRLVRVVHPDAGGDHLAFGAVQQAYEHVRTPQRRAQYDEQELDEAVEQPSPSPQGPVGKRIPPWVDDLVDSWFFYGTVIIVGFAAIAIWALFKASPVAAIVVGACCLLAVLAAALVSFLRRR